ncbi:Hypothetical protein, putative [Bodo saltans]|uniref:Uncharacterized protein n=1 Tax=Bodo saltans TaxID=75058 RepID=A0A0S4J2Y1_BODSA|nr:Hypothetical protein, putative [Bodo saltans]|eukprot:CUG73327.1 Hypothetical protein, putative [Bodo saltans]
MTATWSSTICACCEGPSGIFCESWCCPFYQIALQHNYPSKDVCCTVLGLCCADGGFGCCSRCYHAGARGKAVAKFQIDEGCCCTHFIACYCYPCSIAQVHREYWMHGISLGGVCIADSPAPHVPAPPPQLMQHPQVMQQYAMPSPVMVNPQPQPIVALNPQLYVATYNQLLQRQQRGEALNAYEAQVFPQLQMYYLKGQTVQALQQRQQAGQLLSPLEQQDLNQTMQQLAAIQQQIPLQSQQLQPQPQPQMQQQQAWAVNPQVVVGVPQPAAPAADPSLGPVGYTTSPHSPGNNLPNNGAPPLPDDTKHPNEIV